MKKLAALLLVLSLMFGLTACLPHGPEDSQTESETSQEESRLVREIKVTDRFVTSVSYEGETFEYHFPNISFSDTPNVEANEEITHSLYDVAYLEKVVACMEEGYAPGWVSLEYDWTVKENVLSIVARAQIFLSHYDYYVFNVDVNTGKTMSDEEVLRAFGADPASYTAQGRHEAILTETFNFLNKEWDPNETYILTAYYNAVKAEESAKPLAGEEGLCLCAQLGSLAGPATIWKVFPYRTYQEFTEEEKNFLGEFADTTDPDLYRFTVENGFEIELDGIKYTLPAIKSDTLDLTAFNEYILDFFHDTIIALNRCKYQPDEYINIISELYYSVYNDGPYVSVVVFKRGGTAPGLKNIDEARAFSLDLRDGSFCEFRVTDGFYYDSGEYWYQFPEVSVKGVDLSAFNDYLRSCYADTLTELKQAQSDPSYTPSLSNMSYTFGNTGNILSVVITETDMYSKETVRVFSVDTVTGRRLGKSDLLALFEIPEVQFDSRARALLGSKTLGTLTAFSSSEQEQMVMEALNRTLSDDYFNYCVPYVGSNGWFYIFGKYGTVAGRGYEWAQIDYYGTEPSVFYYSLMAKG